METQTSNPILEQLKNDVFSYLTGVHNNQIKGFYDFTGYWKKKDEAMTTLSQSQKDNLPALYEYMNSITIEQIAEATQQDGLDWIRKYAKWNGRPSNAQKEALRKSYCSTHSDFVKKNWEILQRTKLHVGACLGIFPDNMSDYIDEVATSELTSTFYTERKSQLSNAIFRLELLGSYLEGSEWMAYLNLKIQGIVNEYKALLESEGNFIDGEAYRNEVTPIKEQIIATEELIEETKDKLKTLESLRNDLRKEVREIKEKHNLNAYSQLLKYLL